MKARLSFWLPTLLWLTTTGANACSACFGKSDSPLAKGMNAGIFVLLGFVLVLWIAFGSFFVFIVRRGRAVAGSAPSESDDSHRE